MKEWLSSLGIQHSYAEFSEADDLFAYYTKKIQSRGVIMVTGDMDLYQLLSDNVYIYTPSKGLQGKFAAMDEFGVPPHQLPLFRSIRGDSSDGLTGVPRFATDKLKRIVSECSCPDDLFNTPDLQKKYLLSDTLYQKLMEGKPRIYSNYKLMKLGDLWGELTEVPAAFDPSKFEAFCNKYGLRQLLSKKSLFESLNKAKIY